MHIRLAHISLISVLVVLSGIGVSLVVFSTAAESAAPAPELTLQDGVLPPVSAASAYVVDLESDTAIYTKEPDVQRPIASVTKLVSSSLFYAYATGTDTATIDWSDVATEGRSGRLAAGQQYQNYELLFPALLESSNDAATTMARVAPVDLVARMNEYAEQQQLHQTHFSDTSGLSSRNVSTARELSTLGISLHKEYPYIFDVTQLRSYLNHINAWLNNNPFATEEGYAGGKHGYTYEANRTAIAFFDEPLHSGVSRRFVYVLLGSDDLTADMATLRQFVQKNVDFK